MKKRDRYRAELVAVNQRREAPRVYAVMAQSAGEALATVEAQASEGTSVQIVGSLSRDLVRRLRLNPGEIRLV